MNKNINSLILGIIIIVSIYIYLSIEDTNNMSGGGVNCIDFKEQVNKIIKNDKIYSLLFGGTVNTIVYFVLLLIIIVFAFIYSVRSMKHSGLIFLGTKIGDGLNLINYAEPFLRLFGAVGRQKYMFGTINKACDEAGGDPSNPLCAYKDSSITQKNIDDYENFLKELQSPALKPLVDSFCQVVQPCNDCLCEGNTNPKCKLTPQAQRVIDHQNSLGNGDKFFGEIPNCCCYKELNLRHPGCSDAKSVPGKSFDPTPPTKDGKCHNKDKTIINCEAMRAKLELLAAQANKSVNDPNYFSNPIMN
jgi:hypothetical protein